jgi:hypothetical protein
MRKAMGRVTRSRAEALLRAPAPDGVATLERWSDSLSGRLRHTDGARLVDAWLVPADGHFVAFMDGPDEVSFDWVGEETAAMLGISREAVEVRLLVGLRDRWAFRGEPAVPDLRVATHAQFAGTASTWHETTRRFGSSSSTAQWTDCTMSSCTRMGKKSSSPCSSA